MCCLDGSVPVSTSERKVEGGKKTRRRKGRRRRFFIITEGSPLVPPTRSQHVGEREKREREMASEKVETIVAGNYVEMEREGEVKASKSKLSRYFWHGGSVYDAWFSCASNQVLVMAPNAIAAVTCMPCVHWLNMMGVCGCEFRWLKCCSHCHTHSPSSGCCQASSSSCSTG